MIKVVVMGCACVVTSSLTPEEIDRVRKCSPDLLSLKDESGSVVYSLSMDDSTPGRVAEDEAVYSRVTSSEGKATITILLDPEIKNRHDTVCHQLGRHLLKLDALEQQIAEQMGNVYEKEKEAQSLIACM